MAFIDFLLNESVVITPFVRMGDGEPVYGTPETRKARMELNPTLVTRVIGGSVNSVPAKGRMFTTGAPIAERSLVQHGGETYVVQSCAPMHGFGPSHLEVVLE